MDQNPYSSYQSQGDAPPFFASSEVLANRSTRFVAAIIDGFILGIPLGIVGLILGVIMVNMGISQGIVANLILSAFSLVLGVGFFALINGKLLSEQGQTWGKKIMDIRIVKNDGSRASFQDILLKRYLPIWVLGLIPVIGGLLSIVNAVLIFRENRKCLHDDIAGTKVIKV